MANVAPVSSNLLANRAKSMNSKIEKGLIGAAVLGALFLLAPMAKQSKEFMKCVNHAQAATRELRLSTSASKACDSGLMPCKRK